MKFSTRASFVLVSLVFVLPAVSFAKEIVGVTEATFQQLKDSGCSYESQPGYVKTDYGFCAPLIAQLKDSIVMRVEAHGEQYWINTSDGFPLVNRYLPNGFYRSGKKLFWVQEGFKTQIRKKQAFSTILHKAQQMDGNVTAISNADFDRMLQSCEYHGTGNPATDPQYTACVAEVEKGRATHTKLAGSIVMKVQDGGQLFYVPAGDDTNPVNIAPRVQHDSSTISLYKYLWAISALAQKEAIDEMVDAF